MNILLAHNSTYYPAHGGGDKSNRLLMEGLAAHGHTCRVVARTGGFGPEAHEKLLRELAEREIPVRSAEAGVVTFALNGVDVHTVTSNANLRGYFTSQITTLAPDAIIASTDDPAQVLLEAALKSEAARVFYLVRTTLAVPFGPDCAFPSASKTDTLRRVDDIIGVSRYVADYVRRWSGIEAVHVPTSLLDPGPWPWLGNFDNEFVTLVNPCAVKGIAIFLALASAMPCTRFAAVPTWGTSQADLEALRRLPNITILNPVDDIDEILGRTRVLLVPSLWAEARSRIVVEAMLRAVPVVASNTGGIPEAKMGVPYLLHVRPIEHYQSRVDENMVPIAEVPPQDTAPWLDALQRLISSRAHYDEIARASREAAMHYATHLSVRPFEELLERAVAAPRRRTPPAPAHGVEMLSPEKRRLLDLRLRKRAESKWFVTAGAGATRLFCFPYAGAGTLAYRSWAGALHDAALWAVRLPGRESRVSEPLFTRMEPLIEALGAELQKHVDAPFSFFGHSMGAGIAFELVRWLRRHHLPLPRRLIVSGARAPQLRRTPVPPLPENELLEQLRRLQGMPQGALENPDVVRLILPVLRADTELYRNYVYADEPPLDIQLHVFGGEDDPNVRPEHLEAWRDQSPARCTIRILRGGHFYFQRDPDAFFAALNTVLR